MIYAKPGTPNADITLKPQHGNDIGTAYSEPCGKLQIGVYVVLAEARYQPVHAG